MELLIIFDRDDRLYRFGEVISGRVVLEADHDTAYSEVWITYQWRTHGRGNRDNGGEEKLTLAAKKTSLRAGERKEFPFHFIAPNGPVTYHGHLLNVDWYLTARARLSPYGHCKSEEDFLLQAGERTGAVILGNKEIPRNELPAYSTGGLPVSHGLLEVKANSAQSAGLGSKVGPWLGGLLLLLFVFISKSLLEESFDWNPFLAFIVPIVTLILVAGVIQGLFANAYRRKLKIGEVWVKPASVYGGSEVYCHVDFIVKRLVHLGSIKASISIRERITRTAGTTTEVELHTMDEKTCTRLFNEDLLEGRWIAFDCALPIASDAPATFSSNNNVLEWIVVMKAELKGWPAWQKSFPITVLPCAFADQQDDRQVFVVA
jgi:hypothetical protein